MRLPQHLQNGVLLVEIYSLLGRFTRWIMCQNGGLLGDNLLKDLFEVLCYPKQMWIQAFFFLVIKYKWYISNPPPQKKKLPFEDMVWNYKTYSLDMFRHILAYVLVVCGQFLHRIPCIKGSKWTKTFISYFKTVQQHSHFDLSISEKPFSILYRFIIDLKCLTHMLQPKMHFGLHLTYPHIVWTLRPMIIRKTFSSN